MGWLAEVGHTVLPMPIRCWATNPAGWAECVSSIPDGPVVHLEDGPIFQELKAEGLAMQHRFAAGPIFAKTGKGFLISEGVANSPAFGQFGFRLEMSRTGTIQASVGGKLDENGVDAGPLGNRPKRKTQ